MIKLKKVISQLDDNTFETIVNQFERTKADNFLFLLKSYRDSAISDPEIMSQLSLNNNSFYVLKSRLYDKVQDNLSTNIDMSKDDVLKQFYQLTEIAYKTPREVASALLHKLEEDLLHFDLHNELVILYSILKRINLYSEKYFHYSQLYNKHIAFTLSIEKSVDILGTFNRKLNQYLYSRNESFLNELQFLHKEIDDYYALNANRPIEIAKNFIELQLHIFCGELKHLDAQEVLTKTKRLISELPDSSFFKSWDLPLEYLAFEYYFRNKNISKAKAAFDIVDENLDHLLLGSGVCTTSDFLTSKLAFLHETKQEEILKQEDPTTILSDPHDVYSTIKLGIYKALVLFFKGKTKESLNILNRILGDNSFKDFIHINLEVKLTLVYLYLHMEEFDLADNLLKNLYRKVKSDHEEKYPAVLDLIKVLNAAIANGSVTKKNPKQKDHMTLFLARNNGSQRLMDFLEHDLIKKFA